MQMKLTLKDAWYVCIHCITRFVQLTALIMLTPLIWFKTVPLGHCKLTGVVPRLMKRRLNQATSLTIHYVQVLQLDCTMDKWMRLP